MVLTRGKHMEHPPKSLWVIYRIPEEVRPEAVQILDGRVHQDNDDLILI